MISAQRCSPCRHFVCIYTECVCEVVHVQYTHVLLDIRGATFVRFCWKTGLEKRETHQMFGKISLYFDMCWVCLLYPFLSIFMERMCSGRRKLLGCHSADVWVSSHDSWKGVLKIVQSQCTWHYIYIQCCALAPEVIWVTGLWLRQSQPVESMGRY